MLRVNRWKNKYVRELKGVRIQILSPHKWYTRKRNSRHQLVVEHFSHSFAIYIFPEINSSISLVSVAHPDPASQSALSKRNILNTLAHMITIWVSGGVPGSLREWVNEWVKGLYNKFVENLYSFEKFSKGYNKDGRETRFFQVLFRFSAIWWK